MGDLEDSCADEGIDYVDAMAEGIRRDYGVRYIPHIVITDARGEELSSFEARDIIDYHQKGYLATSVIDEAKRFLPNEPEE